MAAKLENFKVGDRVILKKPEDDRSHSGSATILNINNWYHVKFDNCDCNQINKKYCNGFNDNHIMPDPKATKEYQQYAQALQKWADKNV